MKIKKLFFAGLALAALVACDKENESGNTLKDGDAYINVKIAYSDPVTKGQAAEPPFYYGTAAEQKINNAYFIFYYADGSFCQYVKKTDLKMNSQGAGASTDKNIEELSDGVVLLRGLKSKQYPVYMSVILNSEDEWIGANIENKSIEEASKAVQSAIATADKNDQVNWTNFMMSSSSFDNSDAVSGYYCTKLKASNFQESEALAIAEGNPVEAYVERLAAKVKVEFAESLGTSGKIGSFTVNGTSMDLYFNVTGWGLNATTKDSYCFKNINTGWTEETLGFKWNDAANFRSYWGKSTNYGTGVYPGTSGSSVDKYDEKTATLNYITYNDLKVGINGNAYCRENTNDPEVLGKNFSGTGVDPNITGTFSTPYASGGVQVQRTCFLNLTPQSHGNSLGVGLASAITKRIFDEIDADAMYTNCMTSTVVKSAMVPCVMSTDKEAVQFCIRTCNRIDKDNPRVIRIKNSLHIGQVMLSEAYYADVLAGKYPGLTALDAPADMTFDDEGTLTTEWLP